MFSYSRAEFQYVVDLIVWWHYKSVIRLFLIYSKCIRTCFTTKLVKSVNSESILLVAAIAGSNPAVY